MITAATHLELIPEPGETAFAPAAPMAGALETAAPAEATAVETEAAPLEAVAPAEAAEKSRLRSALEIAGGLALAPILGLAFVIFLPVIGFAALFWVLGERLWKKGETPAT